MLEHSESIRASHVNQGTAVPRDELPGRQHETGPVARLPKLHLEEERGAVAPYGGLTLVAGLARAVDLPQLLNEQLDLFKVHKPYTEADHVLAQACNLFVGGTCIEDMANLQHSEAVRRILGAARLPDPTTGGDFLRRFDWSDLEDLDRAIDAAHEQIWHLEHQQERQGDKRPLALVDLDSHVAEVYGTQKQGADFNRNGRWCYHPFVMSLAGTHEVLRIHNRPGNSHDATGATDALAEVLPMLLRHHERVVVRGDSQFYRTRLMDFIHEQGQHFALVMRQVDSLVARADALPDEAWTPYQRRAARERDADSSGDTRQRGPDRQRQRALERGMRDMQLDKQWVAELEYSPSTSDHTYRVIVRRQRIETTDKQGEMFDMWRYRFAITNLQPPTPTDVLDITYQRCDQENIIEQLKNGSSAVRMPTGTLLANAAFNSIGRLAHNLKSWLALLVLPAETLRWQWKRFRQAFVYVAATVVRHARQTHVRLGLSHRHHRTLIDAYDELIV